MKQLKALASLFFILACFFAFTNVSSAAQSDSLIYFIKEDNIELTSYQGTAADLIIPAEINGLPVTAIADDAFASVSAVKSIHLPASIVAIGKAPFSGCTSLEKITTDAENKAFCSVDGVLYTKDLKTMIAYPANKKDESYTMPEGMQGFAEGTVLSNNYLKTIKICSTLFSADRFEGCGGLKNFVVDERNTYYKVIDGALYQNQEKGMLLVYYPPKHGAVDFVAAKGTHLINWYAFKNCKTLKSVTINEGVEIVGNYAFEGCTALEEINIPKYLIYFGHHTVDGCTSLKTVNVFGPWIHLVDNLFKDCPPDITVYYIPFYENEWKRPEQCALKLNPDYIAADTVFSDVASDNWAHPEIGQALSEGVIDKDGGRFDPDFAASRLDFIIWTVRSFKMDYKNSELPSFTDMESIPKELQKYVIIAWQNGFLHGDGYLDERGEQKLRISADAQITREQAAAMIVRASLGAEAETILQSKIEGSGSEQAEFADEKDISGWAYDYIAYACKAGILKGDDQGNAVPLGKVTRAQTIAMLMRCVHAW